jgi:hypothetical protein
LEAEEDGAGLSRPDLSAIDLHHRREACSGAAKEDLFRHVELGAVHRPFLHGIAKSRAEAITVSRVIPSRMFAVTGGVMRVPLRTMKMFSALPSATWPSSFRTMASSKPARYASVLAKAEFT